MIITFTGHTNLRQHGDAGPTVMVNSGNGVFINTDDGRTLIDGFSGLGCTSLGYHNDRLANAAKRQMDELPFAPTFYGRSHPKVAELAERLTGMAAVPMDRVMFQCSGSEANDAMIKFSVVSQHRTRRTAAPKNDLPLARLLRQHCGSSQLVRPAAYAPALRFADE